MKPPSRRRRTRLDTELFIADHIRTLSIAQKQTFIVQLLKLERQPASERIWWIIDPRHGKRRL